MHTLFCINFIDQIPIVYLVVCNFCEYFVSFSFHSFGVCVCAFFPISFSRSQHGARIFRPIFTVTISLVHVENAPSIHRPDTTFDFDFTILRTLSLITHDALHSLCATITQPQRIFISLKLILKWPL